MLKIRLLVLFLKARLPSLSDQFCSYETKETAGPEDCWAVSFVSEPRQMSRNSSFFIVRQIRV